MIVIDASIALSWVFPDEGAAEAEIGLKRVVAEGALVPALWPLEVLNGLLVGERKRRLKLSDVPVVVALFRDLPLRAAPASIEAAFDRVSPIARDHRLTSYDAAYLALALDVGLPLATLDEPLLNAARALGIPALV